MPHYLDDRAGAFQGVCQDMDVSASWGYIRAKGETTSEGWGSHQASYNRDAWRSQEECKSVQRL